MWADIDSGSFCHLLHVGKTESFVRDLVAFVSLRLLLKILMFGIQMEVSSCGHSTCGHVLLHPRYGMKCYNDE